MKITLFTFFIAILLSKAYSQVDETSLKNYFVEKLNETSFTSKALPYARDAASRFLQLATCKEFDKVYSYDLIMGTYSINAGLLPDNLKRLEWDGSKNSISKNMMGQYTAKPDKSNKGEINQLEKKFNTLVASWLNEYLTYHRVDAQTKTKKYDFSSTSIQIQDLSNYILSEIFKNNKSACRNYLSRIESEEAVKQKLMTWAKELLDVYKKIQAEDEHNFTYQQIKNESKLRGAIENGDWNTFLNECNYLGWTPITFLRENGINMER